MKDPEYKKQLIVPFQKKNVHKDRFGRYPPGFDHFENPEKYLMKFPERSVGHYHAHMNRDCTFYEFVEIMVSAKIADIRYELSIKRKNKRKVTKPESVYNPLLP